jgi:hypothetical protein
LRQRIFKAIDPLPIGAKTVSIVSAVKAIYGTVQWLFLGDKERFKREKHLEFLDIRGSVDIDKIRNILLELQTRSSEIREPRLYEAQYNSIEELKKELKEKDERTTELETQNAKLKEQLSKK